MWIAWAFNINPLKIVSGYTEILFNTDSLLRHPWSCGSEILAQRCMWCQEIPTCISRSAHYGPSKVLRAMFLVYGPALFSFWLSNRQCLATHTSLSLCSRGNRVGIKLRCLPATGEHMKLVITKIPSPPLTQQFCLLPESLLKTCWSLTISGA